MHRLMTSPSLHAQQLVIDPKGIYLCGSTITIDHDSQPPDLDFGSVDSPRS